MIGRRLSLGYPAPAAPPGDSVYAAAVMADTPLAYYRLQETSGLTAHDETGTYHATMGGGALALGRTGPLIEGSLAMGDFDVSSFKYITLPSELTVVLPTALTIEFWSKRPTSASENNSAFCLGNPFASAPRMQAHMPYGGTLYWDCGGTGGQRMTCPWLSDWQGAWVHFALTSNGVDTDRIYANGVEQNNSAWTSMSGTFAGGMIGGWPGGSTGSPLADIAEFAVYDHELSAARVLAHYHAGAG